MNGSRLIAVCICPAITCPPLGMTSPRDLVLTSSSSTATLRASPGTAWSSPSATPPSGGPTTHRKTRWGWALPVRSGGAYIYAQFQLWYCTPGKGIGLYSSLVSQGMKRRVGVGLLTYPWHSATVLEVSPVDERDASL